MDAFFQWLSSNIIATTILILAFGVFVIIYTVAFIQGREISFWPPKIGPKNTNANKQQESDKPERYLKFEWHYEIKSDDISRNRLETAATIDWMAVHMNKTLQIFDKEITNCLKSGGQIRLLLVDPEGGVPKILAGLGDKYENAEAIINLIKATLYLIKQWHKMIPDCKLEVRFIKGQPPYRLMIVNRALDKGYIRLRWVVTPDTKKVPTVVFSKEGDPKLKDFFDFTVNQFEEYWKMAKTVDIDELLKQEKAG